ncbi:hypothetical protein [Levilactobacillus brevis]|uniref:hypothetical protein n=1 Tax=Levilactobacillus brevis TaxID=1580 RepID=UPI0021A695B4|nr:hypothetical protein [Levilactobacillus brevis]
METNTEDFFSISCCRFTSGFIALYQDWKFVPFRQSGTLHLLFSICNLLFGEIAVSAFGIWGAMRPQNAQQHKRSWILTLLLGILWLSVGVFGLMS